MSDRVLCSYCNEDITDYYTDKFLDDEGNLICPVCGGVMLVECNVTVEYVVTPVFEE